MPYKSVWTQTIVILAGCFWGWGVVKWFGHMATDWVTLRLLIVPQPSLCFPVETGLSSQLSTLSATVFMKWSSGSLHHAVISLLSVSKGSTASIFRVTAFGSVGCQNACAEEMCRLCRKVERIVANQGYGKGRGVRRTEPIAVIQETIM